MSELYFMYKTAKAEAASDYEVGESSIANAGLAAAGMGVAGVGTGMYGMHHLKAADKIRSVARITGGIMPTMGMLSAYHVARPLTRGIERYIERPVASAFGNGLPGHIAAFFAAKPFHNAMSATVGVAGRGAGRVVQRGINAIGNRVAAPHVTKARLGLGAAGVLGLGALGAGAYAANKYLNNN